MKSVIRKSYEAVMSHSFPMIFAAGLLIAALGSDDVAAFQDANKPSDGSASQSPAASSEIKRSADATEPAQESTPTLGVAVVNLDRVAVALDRVESVQKRLQEKKDELVSRLRLLNEGYQQQVAELMSKYGDQPTDEQKREIAKIQQEAIGNVEEAMKQGRNELSQYEQTLRQEFQDEVRPIAYKVAIDAGFPVVLTSSQVFAYRVGSPQDITERVIQLMRVQSPSRPHASLPELSTPPTKKR